MRAELGLSGAYASSFARQSGSGGSPTAVDIVNIYTRIIMKVSHSRSRRGSLLSPLSNSPFLPVSVEGDFETWKMRKRVRTKQVAKSKRSGLARPILLLCAWPLTVVRG